MLEGIPGIDSFAPIQLQQFCEQVLSFWMQVAEPLAKRTTLRLEFLNAITTRKLRPARHVVLVRRTDQLEDDLGLVEIGFALEDGSSLEHFGENATSAPHVYGRSVSP
jgi:hypothetical protein